MIKRLLIITMFVPAIFTSLLSAEVKYFNPAVGEIAFLPGDEIITIDLLENRIYGYYRDRTLIEQGFPIHYRDRLYFYYSKK